MEQIVSSGIHELKNICEQLQENEEPMNKNFWAVNMHGMELKEEFEIPKGIRIITFCYSGSVLRVCPSMDNFVWREILLNEDACYNYCTFLNSLLQHSTFRKHFCVYTHGTKMRDLYFTADENFRSGTYKLPVKAMVYDNQKNKTYISTPDIFFEASLRSKYTNVVFDINQTGRIIKNKNSDAIIFTTNNLQNGLLSAISNVLLQKYGGATILLLTCRTGEKRRGMIHPPKLIEEAEDLYEKYKKEAEEMKRNEKK